MIFNIFKLLWYIILRKMQNVLAEFFMSVKGEVAVGIQKGFAFWGGRRVSPGSRAAPAGRSAPRQLGTAGTALGNMRAGMHRGPSGGGGQQHFILCERCRISSPWLRAWMPHDLHTRINVTAEETQAPFCYRNCLFH